jgi:hypothetical protein
MSAGRFDETCKIALARKVDFLNPQSMRHGDLSGQCRKASSAQAVVLSAWHVVQGFGILYLSVIDGVMKANVCARTFTSAIVVSILGI